VTQRSAQDLRPQLITFQIQSIGLLKELLLPLRTKVNVDHAGLSLLLEHLKENTSEPMEHLKATLNNNWLTALKLMEMEDAMED